MFWRVRSQVHELRPAPTSLPMSPRGTSVPTARFDVRMPEPAPPVARGLVARGMIALIRVYQRVLSPLLVLLFGPACRFEPSCSKYAVACIAGHGAMRGSLLSIVRLCKCHPFHSGGFDPPPPGSHGRFPPSPLGSSPEQIPLEGGHFEHTHALSSSNSGCDSHSDSSSVSQSDSSGEAHALSLRP